MAADNRPALRERLIGYCDHVPPSANNGTYSLALKFKADVVACRKLAKKANATESELNAAINKLHAYW